MAAADHSDDLDQLLDSALDDFQSLNIAAAASQRSKDGEEKRNCMPSEVQGLGMGLPDLRKKMGKQKKDSKAMKDSHASEALDKLTEHTMEAVKGLESMNGLQLPGDPNFGNDAMMEEWVKQFEELAGSPDMESMVETMMQQLLSKEILHEPMKEMEDRYPKWLEENKAKLANEEYCRYNKQYELIKELNRAYETDPANFKKIVDLMQKMQECGQPPNDIVHELAPDFDLSTLGQITPEMLESKPECCIT